MNNGKAVPLSVIIIAVVSIFLLLSVISAVTLYIKYKRKTQKSKMHHCRNDMSKDVQILLIGQTGSGKSSTGNTILGKNAFESRLSSSGVTRECSKQYNKRFGLSFYVTDTPGLDISKTPNQLQKEIKRSDTLQVNILIIRPKRFTLKEANVFRRFEKKNTRTFYSRSIVIFTEKDELDKNGMTLTEYIKSAPQQLNELIEKCSHRYLAFNNNATLDEKEEQAKKLLNIIKTDMLDRNETASSHISNEKEYDTFLASF